MNFAMYIRVMLNFLVYIPRLTSESNITWHFLSLKNIPLSPPQRLAWTVHPPAFTRSICNSQHGLCNKQEIWVLDFNGIWQNWIININYNNWFWKNIPENILLFHRLSIELEIWTLLWHYLGIWIDLPCLKVLDSFPVDQSVFVASLVIVTEHNS